MTAINWASHLSMLAHRFAGKTAVTDLSGEMDYTLLMRKAAALGGRLRDAGVSPGDPVATFLRNGIPAVWVSYGVVLSGAAEVTLNPAASEADRRHCLTLAGARHIVTRASDAGLFSTLGMTVHCIEEIGETELDPHRFPNVEPGSWARIFFTSGTTGPAKGVVYDQNGRWAANLLLRASLPWTPTPQSRLLLMTPFSHGASLLTYAYLDHGASVTLLDGVDPEIVLPLIERGDVEEMFAPPTVLSKIVAAAGSRRLPGLRTIFCGTDALSPLLHARASEVFGPVIRVTYGKTEVLNPITVLEAAETDAWYTEGGQNADACVGWPASGVELSIRTNDGMDAGPGTVGEVDIRARHMMAGYLGPEGYRPMAPAEFHRSGDLGYIDERGRLHLVGRASDFIKTGGYKVTPDEIERALADAVRPGVIAVFAIPSQYWGEVIVAAVERPGPGWEEEVGRLSQTMTNYKRPRACIAIEELPRNATGKIRRAALREYVLERFDLIDGPQPVLQPRKGRESEPA